MRLASLIQEIGTGRYVKPSKITVAEFFNRWLQDHAKAAVRPATFDMYEMLTRVHIVPEIGHIRLEKITPMDVQRFIARKREGPRADGKPGHLSPTTVRHIYNILRMALRYAVKWGLIFKSPAEVVDPPRLQHKEIAAWPKEEAERFLGEAMGERLYPAFLLALKGGLRRGEILALRWQDIDFDRKALSVRRSLVRSREGQRIQETKTSGSRRVVALSDDVMEALKRHREEQTGERALFKEAYEDQGLVFASPEGRPLDPRAFTRLFERIVKRAGVSRITFHDLRHTHATLLLQMGVHPKVVAERLGHSGIRTTLDTYSHVLPSLQAEAARALDDLLSGGRIGNPIGNPTGVGNPEKAH